MPRRGNRRIKRRSEKEEVSERELKKTPRCFVLKQGKVGLRLRGLVQDFREVMLPNCAKALRESKMNRVEDFMAVAGHFHVSHLVIFTKTQAATYMKFVKLPQGPTITFKVESFTHCRDVRASQRKPRIGRRDHTVAALQVLNGFSGQAAGATSSTRLLVAEVLRGLFPPVDITNFNQAECRRTALFSYDPKADVVHFRHFTVAMQQAGLQRGVMKLLRRRRPVRMGNRADIADFVLDGGIGASDSEVEDRAVEVPSVGDGKVAVRLTEIGPRLTLQLIKAEEGVLTGTVLYHRYQKKTPSQQEVLQQKARQRQKLKERNAKLEAMAGIKTKAKKNQASKKAEAATSQMDGEEEDFVDGDGPKPSAKGGANTRQRFHPFARKVKAAKSGERTVEFGDDAPGAKRGGKGHSKGGGKGRSKGGGGKGRGGPAGTSVEKRRTLNRFQEAQKKRHKA